MSEEKTYRVEGELTISVSIVVVADSEEEARQEASCAAIADWEDSGELDGDITITDVYEE